MTPSTDTRVSAELTAEDYVFEFVSRGETNPQALPDWEKPFQEAGLIERARSLGYIWIAGDVRCSVEVTPLGRMLVRAMRAEAALTKARAAS